MKKTTYINILILIPYLLMSGLIKGQEQIELTLEKAVDLAIKNNWDVKKMEAKLGMAKSDLIQANSSFLPNINLSETFINTTDPLNVFGFKLKQKNVAASDFNPVLLNDPDDVNNFMTKIQVEQPLLNVDALTVRSAASANVKATELHLKWTKSLIGLQAKYLYFQLQLTHAQKEVLESTQKALQEALITTQNYYDQNLIAKVDLLEMQLRLNEVQSQLLAVQTQITTLNSQFAHFLGYPVTSPIIPVDEVKDLTSIPLSELTGVAIEDRSDLKALSFQLKASNRMLNSSKFRFLPRLNAFGSYEWNDKNAFGTTANNYLIGARLEWDIFKGGRNLGEMQKMKHQKKIMQISYDEKVSKSQQELGQVKNQLIVAKKQVELTELAVVQATEAFKLKSDRYKEGLEKTAEVLKSEATLFAKRVNQLNSINQYQQLVFNLELLLEKEFSNQ